MRSNSRRSMSTNGDGCQLSIQKGVRPHPPPTQDGGAVNHNAVIVQRIAGRLAGDAVMRECRSSSFGQSTALATVGRAARKGSFLRETSEPLIGQAIPATGSEELTGIAQWMRQPTNSVARLKPCMGVWQARSLASRPRTPALSRPLALYWQRDCRAMTRRTHDPRSYLMTTRRR